MTERGYYSRMVLYAVIAATTALLGDLGTITQDVSLSAQGWLVVGLKAFLAGAIAVRAFIDKSPSLRS